jgi:hypothetical protein
MRRAASRHRTIAAIVDITDINPIVIGIVGHQPDFVTLFMFVFKVFVRLAFIYLNITITHNICGRVVCASAAAW